MTIVLRRDSHALCITSGLCTRPIAVIWVRIVSQDTVAWYYERADVGALVHSYLPSNTEAAKG